MKKYMSLVAAALVFLATNLDAQDNKKLAQTGMQFLSVVSDARAAALGEATIGLEFGSSSMFFNPAGMASMKTFIDGSASLNQWLADINYNTFSLAIRPASGKFGVFGLSFQTVDYGEVMGTVIANNDLGYEVTGDLSSSAIAAGVGYAKAITDRFSVGGQVKYVRQELGESVVAITDSTTSNVQNDVSTIAFDFGTLFKTGLKSLAFGMSVRNFSEEITFAEESFQLPLVFAMGVSFDLQDFVNLGSMGESLMVSVDATHFRSHPEQLKVGVDYNLLGVLSLRGGYVLNNDEDDITFGLGVSQFGVKVDYAYTPMDSFQSVQRFTARFSF